MMFGVYRTPLQFVNDALLLPHPFDMFCDVPDCVLRLIFMILTKGPLDMAKYRMGKISQWRNWLEELASQERTLHDNMDTEVGMVLKSKNILLLERIAKDLDWPDRAIFTDVPGFLPYRDPETNRRIFARGGFANYDSGTIGRIQQYYQDAALG